MNNQFQPNQFQSQYSGYSNPYMSRQNGIIWVQGIEGAKAYQLMPSSNAVLMDSESDRLYIKTCDNIGMCNLRIFEYKGITEFSKSSEPTVDMSQFITKDELEEILNARLNGGKNNAEQSLQSTKLITE